jgi:hypothetical protein
LGDDLFGEFILRALGAIGVDISAVLRQPPPTRTTLAFVEVSEDGDREFTFYRSIPAADELLSPEDIKCETLSGASFVNFGSDEGAANEGGAGAVHVGPELAWSQDLDSGADERGWCPGHERRGAGGGAYGFRPTLGGSRDRSRVSRPA